MMSLQKLLLALCALWSCTVIFGAQNSALVKSTDAKMRADLAHRVDYVARYQKAKDDFKNAHEQRLQTMREKTKAQYAEIDAKCEQEKQTQSRLTTKINRCWAGALMGIGVSVSLWTYNICATPERRIDSWKNMMLIGSATLTSLASLSVAHQYNKKLQKSVVLTREKEGEKNDLNQSERRLNNVFLYDREDYFKETREKICAERENALAKAIEGDDADTVAAILAEQADNELIYASDNATSTALRFFGDAVAQHKLKVIHWFIENKMHYKPWVQTTITKAEESLRQKEEKALQEADKTKKDRIDDDPTPVAATSFASTVTEQANENVLHQREREAHDAKQQALPTEREAALAQAIDNNDAKTVAAILAQPVDDDLINASDDRDMISRIFSQAITQKKQATILWVIENKMLFKHVKFEDLLQTHYKGLQDPFWQQLLQAWIKSEPDQREWQQCFFHLPSRGHIEDFSKDHIIHHMRKILMILGADPTHNDIRSRFSDWRSPYYRWTKICQLPIIELIYGGDSVDQLPKGLRDLCAEVVCARADNFAQSQRCKDLVIAYLWGHKDPLLNYLWGGDAWKMSHAENRVPLTESMARCDAYTLELLDQCIQKAEKERATNELAWLRQYREYQQSKIDAVADLAKKIF